MDTGRERIAATPWIQNVVSRLLGMRGENVPYRFAPEVRAVFDVSRRDPELLRECGFVPWSCVVDQPAVVGQFGVAEVTVQTGFICVIVGWATHSAAAQNINTLWATAALQAPIAVASVFSTDSRISTVAVNAGIQINGATLLASPASGVCLEEHAEGTAPAQARSPVVIGGPSIGPAPTWRVTNRGANLLFRPTIWGYTLRLVP